MKSIFTFICALFFLSAGAQWNIHQLSEARDKMSSISVGDSIYFAGGSTASRSLDIMNNITGNWSSLQLSHPKKYPICRSWGNKIYFISGYTFSQTPDSSRVIDIYDRATQQWSTDSIPAEFNYDHFDVLEVPSGLVMVSNGYAFINSNVFVAQYFAATSTWDVDTIPQQYFGAHASVWNNEALWVMHEAYPVSQLVHFNFVTKQLSFDTLPEQVVDPYITTHHDKTFITGGRWYTGNYPKNTMLVYDHLNDTTLDYNDDISGDHLILIYGEKILFAGGTSYSNNNIAHNGKLLLYDALTDSFITRWMPQQRGYLSIGAGCGKFMVAGGWNYSPVFSTNDIDIIDTLSFSLYHDVLSSQRKNVTIGTGGNYAVFAGGDGVNDNNNPYSFTDTADVIECLILGMPQLTKEPLKFTVSPNPSSGEFNISCSSAASRHDVFIYNSLGTLILREQFSGSNHHIDASGFSPGIYLVKVDEGWMKLVKQ